MKARITTLVAIIVLSGIALGQEPNEEEQIQYEKLKVLEPLVGTYIIEGTNEENGTKWEWVNTIGWNGPSKSMLIIDDKIRWANAEEDVKAKDWVITKTHHYFVWNATTQRIEYVSVWARQGTIVVNHVIPQGEGVYSMSRLSTTESPVGNADMLVKVDDTSLEWKVIKRTTPDGAPADDMVFNWTRVTNDE